MDTNVVSYGIWINIGNKKDVGHSAKVKRQLTPTV